MLEQTPPLVGVAGEALIDLAEAPDGRFDPFPGGGPFNTAIALGRLGVPTEFLGRMSTDGFGSTLRSRLAAAGVGLDPLLIGDEYTTLALVRVGPDGGAAYSFYFSETAAALLRPGGLPPLVDSICALMFGTLGMVLEPTASTYEALLLAEAGRRCILLDPNIRPLVIHDRPAYLKRLATWAAASDVVKLSDADAEWLYPDLSLDEVCAHLLSLGAGLVVITRGPQGLIASTSDASASVAAPVVEVRDTIGAGDTVFAALADGLWRLGLLCPEGPARLAADQLRWILERAARAAAHTVSRPGADPPWLADLDGWENLPT